MRHWLRSYLLLLRWNLLRLRARLPFMFIVQMLIAVGIVVGLSYLVPDIDEVTALYLATGAPTVALVTAGMVLAPQMLAFQKMQGLFDFQRAMPVPRLAMLAADATVWVGLALPGTVVAILVAFVRFDLDLTVSPLLVPALLLVALVAVAVGYGIGYAVKPELTGIISNAIIIATLMFSPVNYPAERLPDWLAAVHQVLPVQYMAQAVRETVAVPESGVPALPFLVLAGWGVAGLLVTARIMTRRA
jgi:ABC-2 type transport system permease protein